VTAACQAQLVNVIAPIRTEAGGPAWRQTVFHPFAITSRLAKGDVLRVEMRAPTYETSRFGAVPALDAVATHDPASGDVTVFVVNRDQSSPATLSVPLGAFPGALTVAESWTLADDDLTAVNTADNPDRVVPRESKDVAVTDGTLQATLPPVSWTAIRLTTA
jgi:alpha-N-arabinofuranosidase